MDEEAAQDAGPVLKPNQLRISRSGVRIPHPVTRESHSHVLAGGFELTSYTTRFTLGPDTGRVGWRDVPPGSSPKAPCASTMTP